jgi:hypothetical protein
MYGEDGDDTLYGDYHPDLFDGGSGSDHYLDEHDYEF